MTDPEVGDLGGGDWARPVVGEEIPRGAWRLMARTSLGAFAAGKLASSVGIWIHNVVAAVVVFQVSHSALLVGAVSMVQFTPQVFLSPWMGALADRGGRRTQVILGRLIIAAGSGGLALFLAVGGLERIESAAPILCSAAVVGIGLAIADPAQHALVPALGAQAELGLVIALTTMPGALARAAGPALGVWLLVAGGPAVAFGTAAAGHVAYALVVSRLSFRTVEWRRTTDRSISAVVRYVRANRTIGLLLLAIAGVGFGVDPVVTLTPALAAGFGAGTRLVAVMASAFGVGAAIAAMSLGLVQRRVEPARIGCAGLGILAASMIGLALSTAPAQAVVSFLVGGVGMMAATTGVTTQVQQRVPEELRGRVMAFWSICFLGSRPVAAALNGGIADAASPQVALGVLAALLLGVTLLVRPARVGKA
jgi:MFS family permease